MTLKVADAPKKGANLRRSRSRPSFFHHFFLLLPLLFLILSLSLSLSLLLSLPSYIPSSLCKWKQASNRLLLFLLLLFLQINPHSWRPPHPLPTHQPFFSSSFLCLWHMLRRGEGGGEKKEKLEAASSKDTHKKEKFQQQFASTNRNEEREEKELMH